MSLIHREKGPAMVIASRSVHVDASGNECSELDPRVAMMVVAQGCAIDEATAARYGLIPDLEGDPDPGEPLPDDRPTKPAKGKKGQK